MEKTSLPRFTISTDRVTADKIRLADTSVHPLSLKPARKEAGRNFGVLAGSSVLVGGASAALSRVLVGSAGPDRQFPRHPGPHDVLQALRPPETLPLLLGQGASLVGAMRSVPHCRLRGGATAAAMTPSWGARRSVRRDAVWQNPHLEEAEPSDATKRVTGA